MAITKLLLNGVEYDIGNIYEIKMTPNFKMLVPKTINQKLFMEEGK